MDISQAPVWFQAVVLGTIQGVAEFLPISSSGHLVLVPELTHWKYMGKEFDVALHFGTLVAILIYFRDDALVLWNGFLHLLRRLPRRDFSNLSHGERLVVQIIIASIPAGVIGLLLDDWLEANFGHMGSIAFFLALFGIFMGAAERAGSRRYELKDLTTHGAVLMGVAQSMALMPGVSRSGSTMTMALLLGLTRAESARFSFLMALPITAAACLLKGIKMILHVAKDGNTDFLTPCLIGVVVSGLSGWFCMHFLMRYLRTNTFTPFVIYRLLLAGFLVWWMFANR